VLRNGSPQQISHVWMELERNAFTELWDVRGCDIYALPPGHFPKVVYFSDGRYTWKRRYNGWPEQTRTNPQPAGKRLTSPWGPVSLGTC
jgi:hypothetical protein